MEKNSWENRVDIFRKFDHYEVYANGEFICSADTVTEAAKEADEYLETLRAQAGVE